MKLALLFTIIPLALGWPPTTAPPIFSVTCILGNSCPTGSICTQTETCRGQCAATPTTQSFSPCTIGKSGACSTGSICTPTTFCATGTPCGGLCLPTQTFPPVIPCAIGNNGPCPTGSTCTPTMFCPPTPSPCGGQCIATPTSSPVIPCVVGANDCPSQSLCSQTMTCGGLCIPTLTPSPTSTARPCGGHHKPKCPDDFKCVRQSGKNCGPDSQCLGVCVRKNKGHDCDDDDGNRKDEA